MDKHDLTVRVGATGVEASERGTGSGIRWLTPTRPSVNGRRARIADQGLEWEYATRTSGIKLSAQVERRVGPRSYEFRYELLGGAQALKVGDDGGLRSDTFSVPRAFALGGDGKTYPAGPWRLLPGQRVGFDFDDAALPAQALPYLLDPTTQFNVATSDADGIARGYGTTYYPPPATDSRSDTLALEVRKARFNDGTYHTSNGLIRWDTSSLPDDASAYASMLRVGVCGLRNDDGRSLTADWYGAWPIDVSDYSPTPQTSALVGRPISQLTAAADVSGCYFNVAAGAENEIPLDNGAGVSVTGYTGLRLHVSGGAPGGDNIVSPVAQDHAVSAEPRLVVDYNRPPFGTIDEVSATNGRVHAWGWAIDPDTTASIAVHVYIGAAGYAITANTHRPDVGAAYPGYGDYHGYDAFFTVATGTYDVCVYAINVPSGPNPQLGCRSVYVPPPNPPPAPTVSSPTHSSSTTWYASNDPQFSFSASDPTHGINGYSWAYTADATTVPDDVADTSSPVTLVDRPDGTGWFHVKARNGASPNLWGATTHFQVNIDATGPAAPAVSSSTHPDQTRWYANNTPSFSWTAADTSGISGYSYSTTLDQNPTGQPDDASEGTGTTFTAPAVADGTWYFHIKAINGAGVAGDTGHYKVLIDAGSPVAPVARSTSHPDDAKWYSNRTTAFAWTPGSGTSPVVAYAHDAPDQVAQRDPDPVSDGAGTTAEYTVSTDGTWYFHVRAQNSAGAWGPSANVKLNVDVTRPEPPTTVASITHPAGVAVSNRTATVTWTPGSDATSGIGGYSWRFTTSKTEEADATAEGDAATLSATSGELSDGIWWFNVKTIDRAGNDSTNLRYGPIVVDPDGPLGLSPTLSGGAVAQSDELGLEHFYPYARHHLGTATGYVHLRTGNLVVQQEDVSVPGQGLNVVVRRTYNAQDPRDLDGLGAGWRLSVSDLEAGLEGVEGAVESLDAGAGLTLANLVSEAGTVVGQVLEFVDGDGTTHRFVRQGGPGSRWDSPPGVSLRIFEETDTAGLVTAYRLVRPDGVTYRAENLKTLPGLVSLPTATWRVTSVSDRNANRLSYEHEALTIGTVVKPRLMRIKHSRTGDAVVVRFSYNTDGLLDAITSLPGYTAPDAASGTARPWERRTTLAYTSGRLTSATEAADATAADGKRTTGFSYDATTGLLAGVTDALGKTTSLGYTLDIGAQRLTTVTDRRAKPWTYAYGPADAAGARTTTGTSPVGTNTTYEISGRGPVSDADRRMAGGNIAKITDAGADTGTVVDSFSWVQNRLVATSEGSSADGTAATTSYAYNDLGLLTKVTEPAPNRADTPGLPAGAATSPVVSTLAYRFASPWRVPGCTAPEPGPEPVTKEAFCEAVADLAQVRVADNYGDAVRRVSDFAYGDDTGRLNFVHQRANGSGAPSGADRTTSFAYYDRGGLRSIDGPRADVADVTTFGDPSESTYGSYDRTGMPTRLTDALGKTKTWAYTPYGKIAQLVDRDGAETTTVFDERDNATRVTDPSGHVTAYGYDSNDQKTTETSPRGTATTIAGDFTMIWTYDTNGWVTEVSGPGADAAAARVGNKTAWNDDATKASDTSAIGGVTAYAYWPNRALKATTAPAGTGSVAVSEYFYDRAGRVRLERHPATNAAGDRPESQITYAPAGGVVATTETSPVAGQEALTRTAYNAHGEVIEARGPRSEGGVEAASSSAYNVFGEATASRRRLSATKSLDTFYGYDAAGNQTCQVQPTGSGGGSEAACDGSATAGQLVSSYRYDALGQLAEQTKDPTNPGHTVAYEYSGEGQQTTRKDLVNGAAVRTTTFAYNPDNTRQSMVVSDHATGKTLATCNWAEDKAPTAGYDAEGNLLATRTVSGTAGCGAGTLLRSQSFAWDHRSWLTETTQKVRSPQSGAMVARTQGFAYNPDGSPATATHDGRTTGYEKYSSDGRLEQLKDWRGRTTTFATFASGAPAATCLGRTGTSGCTGGAAKASFAYLPDGSPSELVWAALTSSGAERARVRSHTAISYDVGGLRTAETVQVEQPGGTTAGGRGSFSYDLAERLVGWTSPFAEAGTTTAPATTYGLDDGGNIALEEVRLGSTLRAKATSAYPSGRLSSRSTETYGGTSGTVVDTDSFSYDGLGQETLRSTSHQEGALPATESARRATGYDPAGYTARADDQRVATDAADVDYVYDTTDRLVSRTETSATAAERTLYFYWGTSGNLAEETDATGATKVLYLVDDDQEALGQEAVTRPLTGEVRTWSWLLPDASGNVATHLDDAGAVVQQSAYDPYGKDDKGGSAKKTGVTAPNSSLGFQSALTDKVTGAVVLGPRQYDPTTSRFTTPDVFVASALDVALGADELTGNRYLFAGANPVAFYEDGHGIGFPKIKIPSPLKAVKKLAKKALPFVPVVGAGIEAISIASGRDWFEGGRKMSGSERLVRTGMLAGGAVLGVGATKVAAKVVEKAATKAKAIAPKTARRFGPGAAHVDDRAFARRPWSVTPEGTARVVRHDSFGAFHQSKSDGLWWVRDRARHGGSTWKVYEKTSAGLRWRADADRYGDFIGGKHKSRVGEFIPWKELSGR